MMFFLGTVYHVFPGVFGRHLSECTGRRAALLIATGGYTVVMMFFLSGVLSEPRRYAVQLPGTEWVAVIGPLGAVLVGIGGLLIAADIVNVLRRPADAGSPGEEAQQREPEPATATA
jgi:Heme/copper-type cytochrome/quinol oxidases, subunit 1